MRKKLPKKYPVLVFGSFTRIGEKRVCKKVARTGMVIFVQKSLQISRGTAVRGSRLRGERCPTAREAAGGQWFLLRVVDIHRLPYGRAHVLTHGTATSSW